MADQKNERQKAKSKGFAELGVPVGSVLTFRKDPSITCTTVDGKNKVEYKGKVYPISGLAKELMQTAISGYHAFKFNGTLLAKLGTAETAAPPSPPKPAETAQVAPQAAASPAPQTVPLPKDEAPTQPSQAATQASSAGNAEDPLKDIDPLMTDTPLEEAN